MSRRDDLLDALQQHKEMRHVGSQREVGVTQNEWEPPIPLQSFEVPQFPVAVLPPSLRELVLRQAEFMEVPVDLPACLALGAIAGAAQGRIMLEVKGKQYTEPATLFISVVLPPGERKTPAARLLRQPFEEAEEEHRDRMAPLIATARAKKEELEAERHALTRDITAAKRKQFNPKASDRPSGRELEEMKTHLYNLASELERHEVPPSPLYWFSEGTPEAVSSLLDVHGRLTVFATEGDLLDILAGHYSEGRAKLGAILSAWSGDEWREYRKGEERRGGLLTVVLAIQPTVIQNVASSETFMERGLTPRFLFSWPTPRVGQRVWTDEWSEVPDHLIEWYSSMIKRLLDLDPGRMDRLLQNAQYLALSDEARNAYMDFARRLEPELRRDGSLGQMQAWGGKLPGQMLRISSVLHIADRSENGDYEPWRTPIPSNTVLRAIRIAQYFIEHTRKTFGAMTADPATEKAETVIAWIRAERNESFPVRDLYRSKRRQFDGKVENLWPVLNLLENHGYIRRREETDSSNRRGRKPSVVFDVNPHVLRTSNDDSWQEDSVNSVTDFPYTVEDDLSNSVTTVTTTSESHSTLPGKTVPQVTENSDAEYPNVEREGRLDVEPTVLELAKTYLQENPRATYAELLGCVPKEKRQPAIGVINAMIEGSVEAFGHLTPLASDAPAHDSWTTGIHPNMVNRVRSEISRFLRHKPDVSEKVLTDYIEKRCRLISSNLNENSSRTVLAVREGLDVAKREREHAPVG